MNDGGQGTHKGEWKDGKRDGHGTYTSTYGDKYVGGWKKCKMNGEGIFDYETGESFDEWSCLFFMYNYLRQYCDDTKTNYEELMSDILEIQFNF